MGIRMSWNVELLGENLRLSLGSPYPRKEQEGQALRPTDLSPERKLWGGGAGRGPTQQPHTPACTCCSCSCRMVLCAFCRSSAAELHCCRTTASSRLMT